MKFLLLSLLILALTSAAFPSPLVFKTTTKPIDSPDTYTEIVNLDTSKFDRLRIHITNIDPKAKSEPTFAFSSIVVNALEGTDELHLFEKENEPMLFNFTVEVPPSRLQIKLKGKGTFKVLIWAT